MAWPLLGVCTYSDHRCSPSPSALTVLLIVEFRAQLGRWPLEFNYSRDARELPAEVDAEFHELAWLSDREDIILRLERRSATSGDRAHR